MLTKARPALEASNPDKNENLDKDVGQILMLYFLFAFLGCSGRFSSSSTTQEFPDIWQPIRKLISKLEDLWLINSKNSSWLLAAGMQLPCVLFQLFVISFNSETRNRPIRIDLSESRTKSPEFRVLKLCRSQLKEFIYVCFMFIWTLSNGFDSSDF